MNKRGPRRMDQRRVTVKSPRKCYKGREYGMAGKVATRNARITEKGI